jgi:hypothetical protein
MTCMLSHFVINILLTLQINLHILPQIVFKKTIFDFFYE